MKAKSQLCLNVRQPKNLNAAWQHVLSSGRKSSSEKTRSEIEKFRKNDFSYLQGMYRELQKGKFQFKNNKGIAPKKKGKKGVRPLVLMPVKSRVVQRSILNTLQEVPQIKKYLSIPTSFGGISKEDDGGVPKAIFALKETLDDGAQYYIKSDIKEFFTKIPIPSVMKILEKDIPDDEFLKLLEKAVAVEVEVLSKYKDYKHYFDYETQGTPQGCCLSPVMGNILLYEFDIEMNKGDIKCLRYLDDFIILAPSERAANAGFKRALALLKNHGLDAYDPIADQPKASKGHINSRFDFLGIEVNKKIFRPSRENRTKLFKKLSEIIQKSVDTDFSSADDGSKEEHAILKTIKKLHDTLKGWGNTFGQCCNEYKIFEDMDVQVDELLKNYLGKMNQRLKILKEKHGWKKVRRARGIHLLIDSKGIKKPSKPTV